MSEQKKNDINQGEGQLKRNLTLFEATIHSVAFVIGTGIFLKPATILQNTGSTGMSLILWIAGGLISLCSALTMAEISAYIPKLGGMYTYLNELYGEKVGFMYGWINMLIGSPTGAAASSIAFATFASYFVPLSNTGLKVLALFMVLFFAGIQMLSTKATMKLQIVATIGKILPIFAIVLFGLFKGEIPGAVNFSLVGGSAAGGFGVALLGVLWAYDGWQTTCTLGSEMIEPEKNLPKSIIISLTFVTAVYAIFNVVIFKTVPTDQILAGTGSVGVQAAETLFGNFGATLVSIGMLISSAGTLNGQILNGARVTLAVAQKKQTIGAKFLGHVNPKYDTPINSLIFMIVMCMIYILSGTFDSITNLTIFTGWVFFVFTVLGVFILRKKYERNDNLYHVPLYPIIPIIGALGGGYLLISTFLEDSITAIISVAVAAIGFPMYFYCKKKYANEDDNK
jgi:APA family basic amino acid/polyamine antiporter